MPNKGPIFNTIRDNIFRSYIFYIPKRYYPQIEMTFIKDIIKPDMVNIIAYSNLERNITTNTLEFNGLDIISKDNLLNNNIDLLIKQKETLNDDAFNHLIEKYKEHVDAHWQIISWMSNNIMIDLPFTPITVLKMFETQTAIFDKHQNKFRSYFGKQEAENSIDLNQYVKVVNKTNEDSPPIEIIKEEDKPPTTQNLKEAYEKPKKEPLITDEKARRFLLETVFNIDAKYLD